MPRGARQKNYTNRTDLIGSPTLPVQTAPGQEYGKQVAQAAAQRAVPMGPTPTAGAPTGPPGASPGGAPPQLSDIMAMAQAHNGPGNKPFTRPTERPGEPVTHGIPGGLGAGPEALTGVGAAAREGVVQQGSVLNLLSNLAQQPSATTAIKNLAARVGAGYS